MTSKDFTDAERQLLIQTVETSTYVGKLAGLVVSMLEKLRAPDADTDNSDADVPARGGTGSGQ